MRRASPLSDESLELLEQAAARASARLALRDAQSKPIEVLQALDSHVNQWIKSAAQSQADHDSFEDDIFEHGALWGQQLAIALDWHWIHIQFDSELEATAVSPSDRSLVIYPFQALYLFHGRQLPVRILRSYEILSEPGRVPSLPPDGLENVLDHVD